MPRARPQAAWSVPGLADQGVPYLHVPSPSFLPLPRAGHWRMLKSRWPRWLQRVRARPLRVVCNAVSGLAIRWSTFQPHAAEVVLPTYTPRAGRAMQLEHLEHWCKMDSFAFSSFSVSGRAVLHLTVTIFPPVPLTTHPLVSRLDTGASCLAHSAATILPRGRPTHSPSHMPSLR